MDLPGRASDAEATAAQTICKNGSGRRLVPDCGEPAPPLSDCCAIACRSMGLWTLPKMVLPTASSSAPAISRTTARASVRQSTWRCRSRASASSKCSNGPPASAAIPTVVDNGPELCGRARDRWASDHGVELYFIDPGKPTQNAYIESFNGRFREECLNLNWFTSLEEARAIIEDWRIDYNPVS